MKRFLFALLAVALAVVVSLRMEAAGGTAAAMAPAYWDGARYNVSEAGAADRDQTAGSALLAEIDRYFLGRAPTAKNDCTGLLAGKDLILVLAEGWKAPELDEQSAPALYRLWSEGARLTDVYAPDWYQGRDGREFALLAGMTPTTIREETALVWTGLRGIELPWALPCRLAGEGYDCHAFPDREGREAAYEALGFGTVEPAGEDLPARLETLASGPEPYFAYWVLPEGEEEAAMERLLAALDGTGLAGDTAVCLVTGGDEDLRGRILLWGEGLAGRTAAGPASELDAAPTLLDLMGAAYDARFLSGRDLFAPAAEGEGSLVSLYGSAFSDWVTDRGRYDAGEDIFLPTEGQAIGNEKEQARYVATVRAAVYDRYVYARKVMETDYFRAAGR